MRNVDVISKMEGELLGACRCLQWAAREFTKHGSSFQSRWAACAKAVVQIDLHLLRAASSRGNRKRSCGHWSVNMRTAMLSRAR
jgi:hypothetical protein